ncbi:hypothetical protein C7B76_17145 [filamentous cyanobacterium CCP2]|nr:hypothetical protein C7B76_17145 [filamentous cyanobacterium CCP2]
MIKRFLNWVAAWLLDKVSGIARACFDTAYQRASPLYFDYVESMVAEYEALGECWKGKGRSKILLVFALVPWAADCLYGCIRLTLNHFRREISLFFYGLKEMLTLMPTSEGTATPSRAIQVFSFLHRLTGSVGDYATKIELRLSPIATVIAWGEMAEREFGFAASEVLDQQATHSFIPEIESGGRSLSELIQEICALPECHSLNINENQTVKRERFWILWVNVPIRDADGKCVEISCIGIKVENPALIKHLIGCWKLWKRWITFLKR